MQKEKEMAMELLHCLAKGRRLQAFSGKIIMSLGILAALPVIYALFTDPHPDASIFAALSFAILLYSVGGIMLLEVWLNDRNESNIDRMKERFSEGYPDCDFSNALADCLAGYNTKHFYAGKNYAAFRTQSYSSTGSSEGDLVILGIEDIVWVYKFTRNINFIKYEDYAVLNTKRGLSYKIKVDGIEFADICDMITEEKADIAIGYSEKYKRRFEDDPLGFFGDSDEGEKPKAKTENNIFTGNFVLDILGALIGYIFKAIVWCIKQIFGIGRKV